MEKPNFVLIMVDTQNKSMLGAYGNPGVDTPNLDQLANQSLRFNRAYTTCPLCTPARGAIFTGLQPQINGAWCNNIAPGSNVAHMGEIFRHFGYRAAFTGKWHLDGSGYFGDGEPGGGFEPDWWYDGKRYALDLGPARFNAYKSAKIPQDLRNSGFDEQWIWGHRVANRAIDFLEKVGNQPFVLCVSFDEPHGPYVAPPEYWEKFSPDDIPQPASYNASLEGKPSLQQIQRSDHHRDTPWSEFCKPLTRFFGCNSYIDREIGRVVAAVNQLHSSNTVIIYTSDHGDMLGAHGLVQKGPMMYEEITNVPFMIRMPGNRVSQVNFSPVSQIDILPTMLDLAGLEVPPLLNGVSLKPILTNSSSEVRPDVLINFHRFAINHQDWGGFNPIRCITDGRYKLAVNLLDLDELYDLQEDPHELVNQINQTALAEIRNDLHNRLLDEMERIRDPFRGFAWANRPWHSVGKQVYFGGLRSDRPTGFSFQSKGFEATGSNAGEKG